MPRFRAVFLDVGGTLLRVADPVPVYCDVLAARGYRFDPQAVGQALGLARRAAASLSAAPLPDHAINAAREHAQRDRLVGELLAALDVTQGFEACREAIWDSWLGTRVFHPFPEVPAVLARLKQRRYIVAAVSNWEPRLETLFANHGLREYFDFVLASEREGYAKPNPFIFHKALRLAGVSTEEAIHVGDNYREDVEAACSLGITAVLVARDGNRAADHSPAIGSLEQLLPLLQADEWIQGRVVSGTGEAATFTQLPWVRRQVEQRLGFLPCPGTFNVRPESCRDRDAWERVRSRPGIPLDPEAGYCAARLFRATVEGRGPAAVVVPEVAGYPPDRVEVLAPVHLRSVLGVVDGSLVTVTVCEVEGN